MTANEYKRRDIHNGPHDVCTDIYCCSCECRECKRPWEDAGRPTPKDCPVHGDKAPAPELAPDSVNTDVRYDTTQVSQKITVTPTNISAGPPPLDLDAIDKCANAATALPWTVSMIQGPDMLYELYCLIRGEWKAPAPLTGQIAYTDQRREDLEFIAMAREVVPRLTARIRELEREATSKAEVYAGLFEYAQQIDDRNRALERVAKQMKDMLEVFITKEDE